MQPAHIDPLPVMWRRWSSGIRRGQRYRTEASALHNCEHADHASRQSDFGKKLLGQGLPPIFLAGSLIVGSLEGAICRREAGPLNDDHLFIGLGFLFGTWSKMSFMLYLFRFFGALFSRGKCVQQRLETATSGDDRYSGRFLKEIQVLMFARVGDISFDWWSLAEAAVPSKSLHRAMCLTWVVLALKVCLIRLAVCSCLVRLVVVVVKSWVLLSCSCY